MEGALMNARQKDILLILLTKPGQHLLVQDIAEKLKCSEKTVRNDLKIIEDFLAKNSSASIIKKPGRGVLIEINDEEKAHLFNQLLHEREKGQEGSDEQRNLKIAFQLLMNIHPITIQELASQYYINKLIIKKDLDKIQEWLRPFQLTIVSKQKIGIYIEGAEKDKRMALVHLLQLNRSNEDQNRVTLDRFSPHEISLVKKELLQLQNKYAIYFTDETIERLIIHVLIIISRTKMKQHVSIEEGISIPDQQLNMSKDWLDKLSAAFAVHFPKEETSYLAKQISGGTLRQRQAVPILQNDLLETFIPKMIQRISELTMIDFTSDQDLKDGLKVHLYSTLNRLHYGLDVENPMLHEIKKMYTYMFDMLLFVLQEMNEAFNLRIPEEEAAYLTLYFQASVERRQRQQTDVKKVVIVCHMGMGTSQLLRTRIERKFSSIHIVGCIAKVELKDFLLRNDIDFIISTIPLTETDVPSIVVSPLLQQVEERRLETYIHQLGNSENESILLDYTEASIVKLQLDFEHRYEVIEYLANVLYEHGIVEKEYAHQAILREKISPTSIGSGMAIPHGHPSFLKKSAIAIGTLKQPIEWGAEKVSLVFLLALRNDESEKTKKLFQAISQLSEQPDIIATLIKETDPTNFLKSLGDL